MDAITTALLGKRKSQQATMAYVEDSFSTYVYDGTGVALDIVNNIDLATDGGMVWVKDRSAANPNALFDTDRGVFNLLDSSATTAEVELTTSLTAFNTDGFSLGTAGQYNLGTNWYTSWAFKKQPRFFDVVTYTGNDVVGREIVHNLGLAPGMIIVKCTTGVAENWVVYHKSLGATYYMVLQETYSQTMNATIWDDTEPTSSSFTIGASTSVNADTEEYVAYLFADDPLGESGDGSDGMIACGSGDNTTDIDLGWEPQYILLKASNASQNWYVFDCIRGVVTGGIDASLNPNLSGAEVNTTDYIDLLPNGFKIGSLLTNTYIYMAIRRPMKIPESGSEVFAIDTLGSTADGKAPAFRTIFPLDMGLIVATTGGTNLISSRLTQNAYLQTNETLAEASSTTMEFDYMNGWRSLTTTVATNHSYMWKRAKGFFDVVTYTGDGIAGRTVDHNLGVVPEMMWVKDRDGVTNWLAYHSTTTATDRITLNENFAPIPDSTAWNNTEPVSDVFSLGTHSHTNESTKPFIAYLFSTLAGVSKVGSYTGNGTSQTIDCGFSAGARFVLVKASSTTGNWWVWDTLRGIVAGTESVFNLDTTDAENTATDSIDPENSGFICNEDATTSINTNGVSYIYYAVS